MLAKPIDEMGFPEENEYFTPSYSGKSLILRQEKKRHFEKGQSVWRRRLFPFTGAGRIQDLSRKQGLG